MGSKKGTSYFFACRPTQSLAGRCVPVLDTDAQCATLGACVPRSTHLPRKSGFATPDTGAQSIFEQLCRPSRSVGTNLRQLKKSVVSIKRGLRRPMPVRSQLCPSGTVQHRSLPLGQPGRARNSTQAAIESRHRRPKQDAGQRRKHADPKNIPFNKV